VYEPADAGVMDWIPVDTAINHLLIATADRYFAPSDELPIYNCTT